MHMHALIPGTVLTSAYTLRDWFPGDIIAPLTLYYLQLR